VWLNMTAIFLCNLSDANEMIKESRQEWIEQIVIYLGAEGALDENICDYRSKMEDLGVDVVLYSNGEIDVFKKAWYDDNFNQGWLPAEKENLIGQWKMPNRIKKIDESGVYYEIHLNEWSICPAE